MDKAMMAYFHPGSVFGPEVPLIRDILSPAINLYSRINSSSSSC